MQDYENNSQSYQEGSGFSIFNLIKGLIAILLFPFKLIISLLKIINEIRSIALGCITLIILTIIGVILLFIFKPAPIWNPVKDFLNAGLQIDQITSTNNGNIYNRINQSTDNNFIVTLSEDDITTLFRQAGIINSNSIVELRQNQIIIYIDTENNDKPLWVFVSASIDGGNNLVADRSGFGRFDLPGFVSNMVTSGVNTITDFLARQNKSSKAIVVFNQLLDQNQIAKNLTLKSVVVADRQAILTFELTQNK